MGAALMAVLRTTLVFWGVDILNYRDHGTLQIFENEVDALLWLFAANCGIYLVEKRKSYFSLKRA
jgi:hypothetical protein